MKTVKMTKAAIWTLVLLVLTAMSAAAAPLHANTGDILSLTATGASQPGDPIQVNSRIQATDSINNSNLYYELIDPSGAVVDTHTVVPPKMKAGDTYDDAWSSTQTPSSGSYTVTLCWSTGNALNCDIASSSTQFSSVPTLGAPLSLLALGLLGAWLWRRRQIFAVRVR